MLDIRVIRDNPTAVQERLKTRGGDHWKLVSEVLACDEVRRILETSKQQLQSSRKSLSKDIGALKAKGQDSTLIEAEVRAINTQIAELEAAAEAATLRQSDLLLNIPNASNAPLLLFC